MTESLKGDSDKSWETHGWLLVSQARLRSLTLCDAQQDSNKIFKQENDITFISQEDHFSYYVRLAGKKRGQEALLGAYPNNSGRKKNTSGNWTDYRFEKSYTSQSNKDS